jgi:arsenate reductase (thioredoxin)
MEKSRVLFMCIGNSCRSQMAEAIVNSRYGAKWEAFSGGSRPAGAVHPMAIVALAEIGIDHRGRSKSIEEFRGQVFDLVVSLCEESEGECPVWLGRGRQVHLPFPDPAMATGSEAERQAAYREVRDAIAGKLVSILE